MGTYFMNALRIVHDCFHVDVLGKLGLLIFVKAVRQHIKLAVHRFLIDMQINGNRLKLQRKCGMVPDGIGERVLTHITATIFSSTECHEGILINAVNRCTRKSEEERIR